MQDRVEGFERYNQPQVAARQLSLRALFQSPSLYIIVRQSARQELATTNIKGLDNALERFAESILEGSVDDPGTTPPPKPRNRSGARWKQELSHEDRMEQKLDRIINLLEGLQ